ncbi:MAG TPA: hypothetical protein VFA38_11310 [Nitrospirales bacterium]|nr:hypothetical protein [Nitrospirales bacterium]
MSSFGQSHSFYLFAMRNGKKKLGYGKTPEDALAVLRMRLSDEEMREILTDEFERIDQRKLQDVTPLLG